MPAHARRLLSSAAVVAGTVAVVVALLVVPGRFAGGGSTGGPGQPPAPTPSTAADAVGSRNWTAITCPGHGLGCREPTVLNLGGARFQHERSHRQAVDRRDPSSRTMTESVDPNGGRRWVLVGADGSSSASELSIRFNDRVAAVIPSGTLTLLSVPGKDHPVDVTVSDYGRSGGREVLRIEEYDALD